MNGTLLPLTEVVKSSDALLSDPLLVACEELLPEDVPFHLEFIQAVLDHVADADDPAKPPTVHHWNVPSTVTRHPAHHGRDAVLRRTGDDR